ncbi:MAG: fumarylacetoacetate hydrolase family protein, partial [Burkholderiales bacterium]
EPEIVLHFARSPAAGAGPRALLECIDWIAHGYEIVDSPYAGWKFRLPDTIGAFGLHGALIVGPTRLVGTLSGGGAALVRALAEFTIELRCNGEVRDRGRGANVLDSPLLAVEQFLRLLTEQSAFAPLAAGEIVTTGTLTAALPIRVGEVWSTALAGIALPGLSLAFEP